MATGVTAGWVSPIVAGPGLAPMRQNMERPIAAAQGLLILVVMSALQLTTQAAARGHFYARRMAADLRGAVIADCAGGRIIREDGSPRS